MKSAAWSLLLILGLLSAVYATPGKVIINGQCVDCNKPEKDDNVIVAGSSSYSLTSGAAAFGVACFILNVFLQRIVH
ncbi:uncharacterized protein LOC115624156 [Scaptodrosophila lebanonensis]|uniref:Uncharacterized protein LOC115624156 n=1 Tax=Drosophila lebanonensis TaxID=7225 RepID=A0A6J2TCU6_DROLE|nr:uncharacterized protein LOC115624156 [Scaptodrosophila lebanonensis]